LIGGLATMTKKKDYATRARRIRLVLEKVDDPVARIVLKALAEALEEAAADSLTFAGKKP
jgi:hypothetical protein